MKAWNSDINSLSVSEDLTSHITITRRRLGIIKKFLDSCSLFINNPNNSPSSLQGSWDILRVDIAIGRASINASLSTMTDIEAMIIQSQTQIDNAKSTLKTAMKQLQQTKASVRGTDLAVYQAQLEQAFAMKRKVESQRKDLVITAPFSGVVTDIVPKISEVVGPGENVVSLLSYDKLQIKVNIVENNIVKVKVGQVAKITFDAMAGKEFTGKVTAIDPAEKEINGTIYYQTTVTLEEAIDFLRPGMTATVWIISHEIQNALYIPASSLFKVGDTWNVKVVDRLGVKEKVVVPGYKDRKGMVQIVSGLSIGETVVLDDKNFYEME